MNIISKLRDHFSQPFEGRPLNQRLRRDNRGFWGALLAALPGAASLASGFLGKKSSGGDEVAAQIGLPQFQQQTGQQLADYVSKYLSQYQPGKAYGGQFSAGMTGAESTGLDQLNNFLAAPGLGEAFNVANQNVMDTAGGKYADPNTSPFINSMVNLSRMNLQDSIDQSRRSAGSRGTYFTKSAIEGENRLRERANTGLDAVVGDFINQERGRSLTAANTALAFDKYKNMDIPLSKIDASQSYGSLPRMLEQADLERQYGDFFRQQGELSGVPQAANSLFGQNTPYQPAYQTPIVQQNDAFGNILSIISKLNLGGINNPDPTKIDNRSIWDKLGTVLKG